VPWSQFMRLSDRVLPLIAVFGLAPACSWTQTPSNREATTVHLSPGIVIETVARYSSAEKAGLAEGDVVLRWRRGDFAGEVQSPFDLTLVEVEQGPLGTVTLEGHHGNQDKVWSLGQDSWGTLARPNFSQALLSLYTKGGEKSRAGVSDDAERWRAI